MNIIGIDFGTTNSIISYTENGNIESYKMGGVEGINYIPSYLAIDEGVVEFGRDAKDLASMGDDSIQVYSRFKILLGETDARKTRKYGYTKQKSPAWAATEFLKKLRETFQEDMRIDQLRKAMVTIPEIWQVDNLKARSLLESALRDAGFSDFDFASEPVAAGAYFIHRFKEKNEKGFTGNFLVFDYGGGTLDVSLIEASGGKIKILERAGIGQPGEFLGKAGVAYDKHTVQKAVKKIGKTLNENNKSYYSIMIEFEQKKIQKVNLIKKFTEKYLKTGMDKILFTISSGEYRLEFTPSLLIESFDELLKESIHDTLQDLRNRFDSYNIDESNSTHFKIVMVGGFSAFWLTQKVVMDFFGTKTLSDKRFEDVLTSEETALAISRGAALIASREIEVETVYPMTIGVMAAKLEDGYLQMVELPLFKKGDVVKDNSPEYIEDKITGIEGKLPIFIDDGKSKYKLTIDKSLQDLFPNADASNNHWKVGISIDHNSFVYVYIADKYGKTTKHELGNLKDKYKDLIVIE